MTGLARGVESRRLLGRVDVLKAGGRASPDINVRPRKLSSDSKKKKKKKKKRTSGREDCV